MQQLMLTRASTLASFTEYLRDIGAPVDRELHRHNLPTGLDHQTTGAVLVDRALKFVQSIERMEHNDDIVFHAIERKQDKNLSHVVFPREFTLLSLYDGLRRFVELAHRINPWINISIFRSGKYLLIDIKFDAALGDESLHIFEWTLILQLLSIIGESQGSDICPVEIGFQKPFTPCRKAYEQLPNTRFLFGQSETSITVPIEFLSRSVVASYSHRGPHEKSKSIMQTSETPGIDFSSSLGMALRAYISDGYPDIRMAAEIAGTSVRTLQRHLKSAGLNYSVLVQHVRYELAAELLRDTDAKIIEVAFASGYEDPAHFARAFRRIAGVSPREFRKQQVIH